MKQNAKMISKFNTIAFFLNNTIFFKKERKL